MNYSNQLFNMETKYTRFDISYAEYNSLLKRTLWVVLYKNLSKSTGYESIRIFNLIVEWGEHKNSRHSDRHYIWSDTLTKLVMFGQLKIEVS